MPASSFGCKAKFSKQFFNLGGYKTGIQAPLLVMNDKFTIINLLNKLATEQKVSWRLKSLYTNGQDKNVLEILIFTLPEQRRKGQITFQADSGQVLKMQYKGFSPTSAENIVDMLLDVINFEKCQKAAGSTDQLC